MTNESVQELSGKKFDEFAKSGLVFIDFFAEWCMPCVMMAPIVEEVSEKFNKKIKFGKVNVGENEALAKNLMFHQYPILFCLRMERL